MQHPWMAWLALLAVAVGSASVSWVRTDTLGHGWMGIQMPGGSEVRVEFVDRDRSGRLSPFREPIVRTQYVEIQ